VNNWVECDGDREVLCEQYNEQVKTATDESNDYDKEMAKFKRESERLASVHDAMKPKA
jgi:hypothetical protein